MIIAADLCWWIISRRGLAPPAYDMRPPSVLELNLDIMESRDPPPICSNAVLNEIDDDKPDGSGRLFMLRGDTEITEWDTQASI